MKVNLLKFFNNERNPFRNPFPKNIPVSKPTSRKKEAHRRQLLMLFIVVAMLSLVLAPIAFTGGDITELVPGTAVLLDQSSGSGNGGTLVRTSYNRQ